MPTLATEDLSKTYGKGAAAVHAVKKVSLSVKEGELVVLMGPSGSGKTTLLLMCGTLLRPDSGKVSIDGLDVTALRERDLPEVRQRKIGFVFQQFNLLAGFSAVENVEVVTNMRGMKGGKARETALKALEAVGLEHRANHQPEDLSGGEKQRVAIARALVNDPRLIIADEPTGNLDTKTGAEIIEAIRQIVKTQSRGALIATHDLRIQSLADRVLTLEDGTIL